MRNHNEVLLPSNRMTKILKVTTPSAGQDADQEELWFIADEI